MSKLEMAEKRANKSMNPFRLGRVSYYPLSLFVVALLTVAIVRLAKADGLGGGGGGGPVEKAKRVDTEAALVLAEIAKAESLDGRPYQELDLNWQCIGNCCLPYCGIAQVLTPKPQPPTSDDDDDIIYIPPPYLPHCENPRDLSVL